MSNTSAHKEVIHRFHVVNFKKYRSEKDHREMIVPVGPKDCISADTERQMTTEELFGYLDRHQVGPKVGEAFIPAHFDVAYGPLPRTNGGVTGAPALACLDSDGLTGADADKLFDFLTKSDFTFHVYSTHSNTGDEGNCRFRLILLLDRELSTNEEVRVSRLAVVRWLADMLDMPVKGANAIFDPACKDQARLLFLPRCSSLDHPGVFTITHWGSKMLPVDCIMAEYRNREESVTREPAKPRTLAEWPLDVRLAAQDALTSACSRVSLAAGDALREVLSSRFTFIGGYVELGLLDEEDVLNELEKALSARAAAFPRQDDRSQEYRLESARHLMDWGRKNPLMPWGFTKDATPIAAKEGKRLFGVERARAQLLETASTTSVDLKTAAYMISRLMRLDPPLHGTRVNILKITTGAGKSHFMREVALEREKQGKYTVLVSPGHALLGSHRVQLLKAGGRPFHHGGTEAPTEYTGGAECVRIAQKDKEVIRLKMAGSSISRTVCPTCPLSKHCEARSNAQRSPHDNGELIILMTTAALQSLADWELPADTLYIFDEQPPVTGQSMLYREELRALLQSPIWFTAGEGFKHHLRQLIYDLLDDSTPSTDTLDALLRFRGRAHWVRHSDRDLERFKEERALVVRLLGAATAMADSQDRVKSLNDEILMVDSISDVYGFMKHHNVTVLSATPTMEFYRGLNVELHEVHVEDFHTTVRCMFYRSDCTRKHVLRDGEIDVEKLKRDLDSVLVMAPEGKKVFLSTYKAISDALNSHLAHLLEGRNVMVSYNQKQRGLDSWSDCDVIISLYEEITPPRHNEDGSVDWSASTQSARDNSCQVHGRGRDVQPREAPVTHIHLGCLAPTNWSTQNTLLVTTDKKGVGFTVEQLGALHTLQEQLGQVAAAKALGVSSVTFRSWLACKSSPRQPRMDAVLEILKQVTVDVPDGTELADTSPGGDDEFAIVVDRADSGGAVVDADVRPRSPVGKHPHRAGVVHPSRGSDGPQRLVLTAGIESSKMDQCNKTPGRAPQDTSPWSHTRPIERQLN